MSLSKGKKLYEHFHQFEPKKIGEFHSSFKIPSVALCVGHAVEMRYASNKRNPETLEDEGVQFYYHEHGGGVVTCLVTNKSGLEVLRQETVPRSIRSTKTLVRLGDCDGFDFHDADGVKHTFEGVDPRPEWYTTPTGDALLVVQSKRRVLALMWGGGLRVEARGVVG